MTTEQDLQDAIDADPENYILRGILGDLLGDQGDERAEGYQALSIVKRRAGYCRTLPETVPWCLGNAADVTEPCVLLDWGYAVIAEDWWKALECSYEGLSIFWKYFKTRKDAEDSAARAWNRLSDVVKDKILETAKEIA